MEKVIGQWYTVDVTEPPWLVDKPVLVRGILKPGEPEDSAGSYICDDITLDRFGGIKRGDMADVQTYIAKLKRLSFVSELVEAHLLRPTEAPEVVMPD